VKLEEFMGRFTYLPRFEGRIEIFRSGELRPIARYERDSWHPNDPSLDTLEVEDFRFDYRGTLVIWVRREAGRG